MATRLTYPVKVEAQLSEELSRWLWLFKWVLAIPHYIVLAFLWTAFVLMSVVAFFSILFTSRYPRSIFEFNVGVLRWSWRVAYYSYGALGTDRYPPFTLSEVEDYPVHLTIDYPTKLSRGLVLVKWWLLAIPHYIVVGLLMGGAWLTVQGDNWEVAGFGLIGILTLVAGFALAFTGRYPSGLFDLVLGLNRWVIRVAAYASLMTDAYPPFRLDLGGHEPSSSVSLEHPVGPSPSRSAAISPSQDWTGGRIFAVVFGSLFALTSLGLLAGGGIAVWVDRTQRDAGFVTSPSIRLESPAHAIVSDSAEVHIDGPDWVLPEAILGDLRVRATSASPVFVGIARTEDVDRYLAGVSRSIIPELRDFEDRRLTAMPGSKPDSVPGDRDFWIASTEGSGTQAIRWAVENGSWSLVIMNADASAGIDFEGDFGAEAPALDVIALNMIAIGVVGLIIAVALIGGAIRRAGTMRKEQT